jgi:hypothetical protein
MHCVFRLSLVFWFSLTIAARTFVIPHFLERAGKTSETAPTFDTIISAAYAGNSSANIDIFLFDNAGQPLRGITGPVCNPCTYTLSASFRSQRIVFDDIIVNSGGGFDAAIKQGFATIVVGGADPDNVGLDVKIMASRANSGDLSVATVKPVLWDPSFHREQIIPYFLEKSGSINNTQFTFDTTFYFTYAGGLGGVFPGLGASIDLYLFDDSGSPLSAGGSVVCGPCTYALDTSTRKTIVRLEDLIVQRGGDIKEKTSGFAVAIVSGIDPAGASVGALVANAHTGPFDLSLTWFAAEKLGVDLDNIRMVPRFIERAGSTADMTFTFDTKFFATYAGGLAGIPPGGGASIDLYLYEQNGITPLSGSGGVVCNPCTFALTTTGPRQIIDVGQLIAGSGFNVPVKVGAAALVVGGADPANVHLQGMIVNSHSGDSDLEMHPFTPQPVPGPDPSGSKRNSAIIPILFEKGGRISNTPYTFDDALYLFNTGAFQGLGGEATVRLYLLDGQNLLRGENGAVCAPCTYALNATQPALGLSLEAVLGGSINTSNLVHPYALLDIAGDVANVAVQSFGVNSHSGPFDLAIFASEISKTPTALLLPAIVKTTVSAGSLTLTFPTEQGLIYTLESRALGSSTWSPHRDLITGDGTEITLTIPLPAESRFYRLRVN